VTERGDACEGFLVLGMAEQVLVVASRLSVALLELPEERELELERYSRRVIPHERSSITENAGWKRARNAQSAGICFANFD
jgi:hypothetical protein